MSAAFFSFRCATRRSSDKVNVLAPLIFIAFLLKSGNDDTERVLKDFDEIARKHRFSSGIPRFIANRERFTDKSNYEQEHSMSQSPILDPILEQILGYVIRDFVDSWYGTISPDQLFKESLKRSTRRTIAAFSQCIRKVDFVPLLTQHIVDDFASHLRLYRKAKVTVWP
ncbi:unnamed protein product [Toxocara canis]|uniref:PXA domain-containing protein n=1 Tax=Toxocara canis TaxID=6265 RepID=A0A183U647_TOXCA|nr:unnamed protein product [Toxocara canis]